MAKYNYARAHEYYGYISNSFGDLVSYDQNGVKDTFADIFSRPGRR